MSSERWERTKEILEQALCLAPEEGLGRTITCAAAWMDFQ